MLIFLRSVHLKFCVLYVNNSITMSEQYLLPVNVAFLCQNFYILEIINIALIFMVRIA